jgi:RTX calcium-binding nonapeptide repeat (4 copies)
MTSRMKRRLGWVPVVLLALAMMTLSGSNPSKAARLTYPGSPGCNNTLQRCINNAPNGSTIRIDRNKAIQENISIEKSITLKPAPGKDPLIRPPGTNGFQVEDRPNRTIKVEILSLDIRGTYVEVFLENGASHVTMRRSSIRHNFQTNGGAAVSAEPYGGAEIVLEDNFFRTTGSGVRAYAEPGGNTSRLTMLGNVITTSDPEESNDGMELEGGGQGKFIVSAHSNVIYGVSGCNCGGASGINIGSFEDVDLVVNLVNNTLDDMQVASDAINVDPPLDTSTLKVRIFNNSVTRATHAGLNLPDADPDLDVQHDYNLYWDNDDPNNDDGYPSGGHDTEADPEFVDQDAGDYMPSGTSALINGGLVCNAGGLLRTDAARNVRFLNRPSVGPTIDIGAFEVGSIAPIPGKMILAKNGVGIGTDGADVICGSEDPDTLRGKDGRDWIEGAGEDDDLFAGNGPDYISGQDGDDELRAVDGVGGNDDLNGGGGVNSCFYDDGDEAENCG